MSISNLKMKSTIVIRLIRKKTTMEQERLFFEVGDVIAFAEGNSTGRSARLFTGWPVNHVGIMISPDKMIESVIIHGVKSVTINDFLERSGEKYLCKLTKELRAEFDLQNFNKFIEQIKDKKYDYLRATLLAINKFIYPINFKEDFSKMFCNELVGGALKAACVLDKDINSAALSPHDIFNLPIYSVKLKITSNK